MKEMREMREIVHGLRRFMNELSKGRGTMLFRLIHTTWMLLFVTVMFTALVNPITLGIYKIRWIFFVIPVAMLIAAFFGSLFGGRIADSFSLKEELIQKVEIISNAFLGCLCSLLLFVILIIMDCVSVGGESYGGISQYSIWYMSLALLIGATLVLAWTTCDGVFLPQKRRITKNV
jgi:hypothetical protein